MKKYKYINYTLKYYQQNNVKCKEMYITKYTYELIFRQE